MNANNNVVNGAFISVAENMKAKDATVRLLLSAALVGVIFTVQPINYLGSIVLALVYLFTTAITHWDPIYSFFGLQLNEKQTSNPSGLSEGSVSVGIDQYSPGPVANDSHSPDDHLKKVG